jgi:hypothetical protein
LSVGRRTANTAGKSRRTPKRKRPSCTGAWMAAPWRSLVSLVRSRHRPHRNREQSRRQRNAGVEGSKKTEEAYDGARALNILARDTSTLERSIHCDRGSAEYCRLKSQRIEATPERQSPSATSQPKPDHRVMFWDAEGRHGLEGRQAALCASKPVRKFLMPMSCCLFSPSAAPNSSSSATASATVSQGTSPVVRSLSPSHACQRERAAAGSNWDCSMAITRSPSSR